MMDGLDQFMVERPDGQWVKYDDAKRKLEAERALAQNIVGQLEERIRTVEAQVKRLKTAIIKQSYTIEQTLGKALGYPWYKDDQKNFPGATDAEGVFVGMSQPEDLAEEAANRIAALKRDVDAQQQELVRLHTWQGLMGLINELYPVEIFHTDVAEPMKGDVGPIILRLLRENDRLRTELAKGA